MGAQRVAYEPDDLREPCVVNLEAEFGSDQLGNLIFEPLLLFVRKRKVIGICADLQLTAVDDVSGLSGGRPDRDEEQARNPE